MTTFLTFLIFYRIVDFTKMLEKSLEEIYTMRQISRSHHFAARVHGKLWHTRINGAESGTSRNGWTNRRTTRTIITDCFEQQAKFKCEAEINQGKYQFQGQN